MVQMRDFLVAVFTYVALIASALSQTTGMSCENIFKAESLLAETELRISNAFIENQGQVAFERIEKYRHLELLGKPGFTKYLSNVLVDWSPRLRPAKKESRKRLRSFDLELLNVAHGNSRNGLPVEAASIRLLDLNGSEVARGLFTSKERHSISLDTELSVLKELLVIAVLKNKFNEIGVLEFSHNHYDTWLDGGGGGAWSSSDLSHAKTLKKFMDEIGLSTATLEMRLLREMHSDQFKVYSYSIESRLKYRQAGFTTVDELPVAYSNRFFKSIFDDATAHYSPDRIEKEKIFRSD